MPLSTALRLLPYMVGAASKQQTKQASQTKSWEAIQVVQFESGTGDDNLVRYLVGSIRTGSYGIEKL